MRYKCIEYEKQLEVLTVMKMKEQLVKELDLLNRIEILQLYNLVLAIKSESGAKKKSKPLQRFNKAYLKAREALRECKGSLADDIISDREERV